MYPGLDVTPVGADRASARSTTPGDSVRVLDLLEVEILEPVLRGSRRVVSRRSEVPVANSIDV
jgi:hypothetical protein